ncbi:Oxidoreductase [[Actinomadura] parvosata subsp. kistnae]|uniref:Aldo/keto reductase n=1 Tax=[Actinomadura] parvosata subsp. kistnae TaxID=1909395 RepID=A0A1V0A2K6_9ACTN|nr:aldo/keto reductase [Nonomuraea sp. ATCC 55076]AQZ64417.1 aldo/keto reductase [Nonomuraea sp. ATCC 55076]SPL89210.1 Oxidoreductase [Actinomadura parvosata subsp. kistnae]
MDHRPLGRTGVKVSPLCLGGMMFGRWGDNGPDETAKLITRALDAGVNVIDTADVYSAGESEELIGRFLAENGLRDEVVLATKVHGKMGEGPNRGGNSRAWIMRAVDDSLRRLRTDHIDLYQIHRPDPSVDIDETLGALTDLVRAGKVRYIGCSTFPAHQVVEAHWAAERRQRERFATEQPPYSILARAVEADLLPVCQRYGMGVLAWSPLAGGWLSGRYREGAELPRSRRAALLPARYDMELEANRRKLAAAERLAVLAEQAGMSLVQLALQFVMRHPAVTSAIIGPRTIEHLDSHLRALDVRLTPDVLDAIDEIVPPGLTINPADTGWRPPELLDPALRSRP